MVASSFSIKPRDTRPSIASYRAPCGFRAARAGGSLAERVDC